MIELIEDATAITPLFPEVIDSELNALALELTGAAGKLTSSLHPVTTRAMAKLVLNMNSYYSNLIEGHFTHPVDIENAIKKDYSKELPKRLMQIESAAHVEANKAMRERLANEPDLSICSVEFLCWLHSKFYDHLPGEMRLVKSVDDKTAVEIVPGDLRQLEVKVGEHYAPAAKSIPAFMDLFKSNYTPNKIHDPIKRIIAIAASHHRLAFIHPFLDGNGRVVRLFSEAYFIKENLDANGLWSMSRGLAVFRKEYYDNLHNADEGRLNDNDGRGNLSDRRLKEFCAFFLRTAIDQVKFMTGLFETDGILERINLFTDIMVTRGELKDESRYLLTELFLRGKIKVGEVSHIIQKSRPTAYLLIKSLLDKKLITSAGEREPLTINFPVNYVSYFFPRLYPPEIEASLK